MKTENLTGDTTGRLTWWESDALSVECVRHGTAFVVRTRRAGHPTSETPAATETRAREIFERTVDRLVRETTSSETSSR